MIVVLPVPGPPVMIMTLFSTAVRTASICFSARAMASCSWTQARALSVSIFRICLGAAMRTLRRAAVWLSAR